MNVNDRMMQRIDAALPNIPQDSTDRPPLIYIRKELTPERLKERAASYGGDDNVDHLIAVAKRRLRDYEKETASAE